MKALTLIRPWPFAIFNCGKDIENRSWKPGAQLKRGELFAIHAGKGWDEDGKDFIEDTSGHWTLARRDHPTGIVGVVRYLGVEGDSISPWFFGPYGWRIDPVCAFTDAEVVPCRGALGLWTLPADVEARVMAIVGGEGRP